MNFSHRKKTMASPLLFQDVRISRMYGTPFDLHLSELSANLNIIFGPNGSGKTTLANALNGFLLASASRAVRLYAEANLCFGPQTLHLDVKGARAECQINGRTVDRDELSQFIRPKSYHLSLQELLPEKTGDSDLAQEIIRQANGGFDIAVAGKKLAFALQKRYNKTTEAKEFQVASDRLRKVLQDQRSLDERRRQRNSLLNELHVSKQAGIRASLIEKIRKWRKATEKYQEALAVAESYPEIIRSSHDLSHSVSKTQKSANVIAQLKIEVDQHTETIASIEADLKQNRLASKGLQQGELQQVGSKVRACLDKYRELEKLNETLEATQEQTRDAWENLGGRLQEDKEPSFTQIDLRRLQKYAKDLGLHTHEKQGLKKIKSLFDVIESQESGIRHDEIRDAQNILLRWILNIESDSPQNRKARTLLLIILVTSALLSIGSGIVVNDLGWLGLLITSLAMWVYTLLRPQKVSDLHISELKNLLPELSENSDIAALKSSLNKLLEMRSNIQLHDLKSQEQSRVERSLQDLTERQSELEAQKKKLQALLDLDDPPGDIISLIEFVDRVLIWRKLDQKTKELNQTCTVVETRYRQLLDEVGEMFVQHEYKRPTSPQDAEMLLEIIRDDHDAVQRAHNRLEQERKILKTTKKQLQNEESRQAKVFLDLNLDVGDLSGLANCAQKFDMWKKDCATAEKLRIGSESLRPHEDLPSKHEPLLEIENLEEEWQSAQLQSEKERELQERLTRLDADIERAEGANSLENALAEKESKRIALENVRQDKAAKAVGYALLESLRESAIQNAPLVFERARENFQRVTDNRYTLIIPQNNSFWARDQQRNRDFDLKELSSATRVQLLLCVRLAFVETQETDCRLPITLDETLANSDDKRAHAIIKAISTLASDRQIFYFTAQQDEVEKWGDFVPENLLKVHSIG